MVDGAVQKFLKEVTLLNQPFVKNDKQTVEQMLQSVGASVKAFTMYVVGEGIERSKMTSLQSGSAVAAAKQA